MAATAANAGALYLSAPKVAITTALATTNPSTDRHTYKITFPGSPAINACMSFDDAITVQHDDGGDYHTMTADEYVMDRLNGVIRTVAQQGVGVHLKVTVGYYLPLRVFMNCKEYDLTIDRKNVDVTCLWGSAVARLGTMIDCKGTMSNFYDPTLVTSDLTKGGDVTQIYAHDPKVPGSNQYFAEAPLGETWIVAQFWLHATGSLAGPSLWAWAKVSQEAMKAVVGDAVTETVQWEGTHDADGHSCSVEGLTNLTPT